MLIFIDESGDPGLKLDQGASRFFVVSLVVFEENDEAVACDKRIELLKRELGWSLKDEFHFKKNSMNVRERFLRAVSPYNFFYYGIVMNKSQLQDDSFKDKQSFYKYSCGLVFENAKEKLDDAIIIIDQSGNNDFKVQLQRYLKNKMNSGANKIIRKIKMQRSTGNNLLQLADYVAGSINRSVCAKRKDADQFRKIISHREISVEIWPK